MGRRQWWLYLWRKRRARQPASYHSVSRLLGRGGGRPLLQTTGREKETLPLMGPPDLGLRLQAIREDACVREQPSGPPGRPSVSGTRASRLSGSRTSRPLERPFASGNRTSRSSGSVGPPGEEAAAASPRQDDHRSSDDVVAAGGATA
jgi:hypothetical protein